MVSKQKRMRRVVMALMFVAFSSVVFVNNVTQLLSNYTNLSYADLNLIGWIGLIGAVIYTIWLASGDEL